MSHVKDFIAQNPYSWLERLVDNYGIRVTRDGDLVSLKYNQVESPMHDPLVQQCRGMVVHAPTGQILAHPYDKFWNHGEPLAAPIDWPSARIMDKLDGSLMILYWDPHGVDRGGWRVASSGHPTAGGHYGSADDKTFADAFWEVFHAHDMKVPICGDCCFMFELVSPENRIVCKYDKASLVLHGARNMDTDEELGHEALVDAAVHYHWPPVVDFLSGYDLVSTVQGAAELDPTQQEGFVVVDANFNRVKVKSPRYVRLHHLRDKTTLRGMIEVWQSGEIDEILSHFPEMTRDFGPVLDAVLRTADGAAGCIECFAGLPSRKDFALQVKDLPYQGVVFKMYGAGLSSRDDAVRIMRTMSVAALEHIVERMS